MLPSNPGSEGVGRVLEVSPEVKHLAVGQLVLLAGGSTWREQIVAPAAAFLPLPDLGPVGPAVIESFNQEKGHSFHQSDFRRNLVTQGLRLNDLVDKTFTINNVSFYGVQLCEPCASLQRRLGVRILPELVGKGGLRAQIRGNGVISVGDSIKAV